MIKLTLSLLAWNTAIFTDVLSKEIRSLDLKSLPLQRGLRYSSIANPDSLSVTILKTSEEGIYVLVTAALFYTGIIAGCNCADDPTAVDEINEYCEIIIRINRFTAESSITLIE
jgi:hypothetical protein